MNNKLFWKIFPVIFGIFFTLIFLLTFSGFIVNAYLGYDCHRSGDPSSMSCYMMSNRHDIGIRNH